jgi:hypothetical protein
MIAEQPWEADAVRLKAQGKDAHEIGALLDKHPASIRKAWKRAEDRRLTEAEAKDVFAETCEHGVRWDVGCMTCVDAKNAAVTATVIEVDERDPLEDFKAEAGEAVGDMPPREPDAALPDPEPIVRGTRQMAIDFGEEAPIVCKATLKFTSEKAASGFFGLNDQITGTFRATITTAPGKLKWDKDLEEWVAAPVDYVATIEEFTVDVGDED